MIGSPIVLSSPIVFSAVAGAVGTASDPSNLRTPEGEAMLVDDIQLWIKGRGQAGGRWHEWEVNVGKAKLTDGYIPPALCTRVEDAFTAAMSSAMDRQVFLWSFARPLYVPLGIVLQVKVRAGSASCSANVAIRGRILPKGYPEPATAQVPYAVSFRPGIIHPDADESDVKQFIYKSNASDLANPFAVPLNLQRFVMGSSGAVGSSDRDYIAQDDPGLYAPTRFFPNVQLYDQHGAPILREMVKLAQVCSAIRGEWAVKHTMQPREVIYATVDQTHALTVGANPAQVGIGMIGWREVPLSEVK